MCSRVSQTNQIKSNRQKHLAKTYIFSMDFRKKNNLEPDFVAITPAVILFTLSILYLVMILPS